MRYPERSKRKTATRDQDVHKATSPASLPVSLFIIQPTPFCNIDCDYCYLPDRRSTRRISHEILTRAFATFFRSDIAGPQVTIVWHAGEPLVLPPSFYADAIDQIRTIDTGNCKVSHSIQTNGILLDKSWCDFIKEHDIGIGVSLDGPAFIHDRHRKTRSGNGTHCDVMRGISLLQSRDISFHVIAVVTQESLPFADQIIEFFLENGIRQVGFNIEEIEGANERSSLSKKKTEEAYTAFMRRIHRLSKASNGAISIREFDRALHLIKTGLPTVAVGPRILPVNVQTMPFGVLSVDCDGNFATFSPELLGLESKYGPFVFGNVLDDHPFESVLRNSKFEAVHADIDEGVALCKATCEYFDLCGGGAPANKYFEHGSFSCAETLYCRYSIQIPIEIALEDLEASLSHRN